MSDLDDATAAPNGWRWIDRPFHRHWLTAESVRLLDFHRAARLPTGGFGALDIRGEQVPHAVADTLITARHTHCYSLAALAGMPGAASMAAHGVAALEGLLRDAEYGGWYQRAPTPSEDEFDDSKQCYIQVFVALGAASATQAGIAGARGLLAAVVALLEKYFWSAEAGAYCESYGRDFSQRSDYRGANSNMHAVELCLALADVLEDNSWRERALTIAERLVHGHAAANDYLVIEHFHGDWREWRDCNADRIDDGFYPYGATPGHSCEWARLLLNLEAGLNRAGHPAPAWLAEDACQLFNKAVTVGWQTDGQPGMVYTVDWQGQPCSTRRRHWVAAEALAAAAALARRTGDAVYERWYRCIWDHAQDVFIDVAHGSWRQELDAALEPYPDEGHLKPDLYHAYQACLLPTRSLAPTLPLAMIDDRGQQDLA